MNYTKPEIVVSGSAICAIQSGRKPSPIMVDANPQDLTHSTGAYEADE